MCRLFVPVVFVFCQALLSMSQDQYILSADREHLLTLSKEDLAETVMHLGGVAEEGMRMFHFTYKSLADQGVAEGIKDKADADYPDFWERYRGWLARSHKAEPIV